MALVVVGQRVKTTDGSKAGLAPTANQGTVLSVTPAVTRRFGGVLMTFDEVLVHFDGRIIPNLQLVNGLS